MADAVFTVPKQAGTWNGRWKPGDLPTRQLAQQVILPLINRGYLSWADFGIRYKSDMNENVMVNQIVHRLSQDLHDHGRKQIRAWNQSPEYKVGRDTFNEGVRQSLNMRARR